MSFLVILLFVAFIVLLWLNALKDASARIRAEMAKEGKPRYRPYQTTYNYRRRGRGLRSGTSEVPRGARRRVKGRRYRRRGH